MKLLPNQKALSAVWRRFEKAGSDLPATAPAATMLGKAKLSRFTATAEKL